MEFEMPGSKAVQKSEPVAFTSKESHKYDLNFRFSVTSDLYPELPAVLECTSPLPRVIYLLLIVFCFSYYSAFISNSNLFFFFCSGDIFLPPTVQAPPQLPANPNSILSTTLSPTFPPSLPPLHKQISRASYKSEARDEITRREKTGHEKKGSRSRKFYGNFREHACAGRE
jgi:hypothetical protein